MGSCLAVLYALSHVDSARSGEGKLSCLSPGPDLVLGKGWSLLCMPALEMQQELSCFNPSLASA